MRITIIGHCTVLIETEGKQILTDPFFSSRVMPIYRRVRPPSRSPESLSGVDLVLVSHLHFDHCDRGYLRGLKTGAQVIAPPVTGQMLRLSGAKQIFSLFPWQSRQFGAIKITAVPAVHMDVTVGYVIEAEGKAIYFAGDTFYAPFMRQIGERFHLTAALIPVTTFRVPMTMDNAGAIKAVQALCPEVVIPVHLDLVGRLPIFPRRETAETFRAKLAGSGSKTPVILLKNGASTLI